MSRCRLIQGDAIDVLEGLDRASVHCVVTSPPYWGLRDYGVDGQGGLEDTPEEHVEWLVEVFRAVRRVLRSDGTLWLNYGDCYANDGKWGGASGGKNAGGASGGEGNRQKRKTGLKPKNLVGMPWRIAFALQADGWYLRSDIVWHKPNPMPEPIKDRPTRAHEFLFLFAHPDSGGRYYYDADAVSQRAKYAGKVVRTNGADGMSNHGASRQRDGLKRGVEVGSRRNIRDVWTIPTKPYPEAHFAVFPSALVEPCVKAGCPAGGVVLDPFAGSGTTGEVALKMGCRFVGIDLNSDYLAFAHKRLDALAAQRTMF